MASANGDGIATSLLPTPAQAEKYKNFKKLHDEAFRLIENGIELEQEGHKQEVLHIKVAKIDNILVAISIVTWYQDSILN
jgi:hypothetical protein